MKLSIVIPARNEERHLAGTVEQLVDVLSRAGICHELIMVDDHSVDRTVECMKTLEARYPTARAISNTDSPGFGFAVRTGLSVYSGDGVAIVMADGSDDPHDLVTYYHKLQEGYDCVFGSRFMRESRVVGYPVYKLCLNRLANTFIRLLFWIRYNDVTNAFKCYSRACIEGTHPLLSHHFNLTVEMPLKAIVRGFSYATVPINWYQRKHGVSKLKIKEMGSRYLFIVLYLFLERCLSRGDYHLVKTAEAPRGIVTSEASRGPRVYGTRIAPTGERGHPQP